MREIVTEKRCSKCKELKSVSEFYKNRSRSDGLGSSCKECSRKSFKEWVTANSERYQELQKTWTAGHSQERREYLREYFKKYQRRPRKKARPKDPADTRDYYERNKQRIVEYARKRYAENVEKERERQRKYAKTHPERCSVKAANRRTRKLGNGGEVTAEEWKEVLNKYGNKCLCCGKENVRLTLDHIVPVVLGGKTSIDNVQPLCQACNSRKHTKIIDYRIKE